MSFPRLDLFVRRLVILICFRESPLFKTISTILNEALLSYSHIKALVIYRVPSTF